MNEEHEPKKWWYLLGTLAAAIFISAVLAAGYWVGNELFRHTGRPPEFWAYMASGLIGFLILLLAVRLATRFAAKSGHFINRDHSSMIGETLEAINRISKGDFAISLTVNEHDPFTELNASVNKMARELGSMETLRQDFISNVSHEIQSPLTSISGFAALLKTDSLTQDQRAHYLGIIETESRRLSKLSDNLLKLSSLETGTTPLMPREFRLDKQIRNAILMLEPQWSGKDITVDTELESLGVTADEDLLSQVWINLLHNAVKFTPRGGEIRVSLSEEGGRLECRISDNGPGIPESDQIHVFERFYKADKSRDRSLGGNGLGLSLCKKIVELHGGTITLQSEPDRGAAFTVSLPQKPSSRV